MKKSLGAKIIVCATHVWVVGTYDKEGKANIMTAAWGGRMLLATPVCWGFTEKGNVHVWEHTEPQGFYSECPIRRLPETDRLCWNLQR
jgi:hypothetical protein